MNQYKNLFATNRTPAQGADVLHTVFPSTSKHVILMLRNQLYQLDVIHPDGTRMSDQEIERMIYAAGQDSLEGQTQAPVGILTAGQRDNWAQAYASLSRDTTNKDNLRVIEEALMCVCLDDFSSTKDWKYQHRQFSQEMENRWFDKGLQLIVTSTGRAGVNGEHTPCDAVAPGRLFDLIVAWEGCVSFLFFGTLEGSH